MAAALALFIGVLTAGGVWLLLRARSFDVILGLTLLGYAVNLFIFVMGRPRAGAPPIVQGEAVATLATHADPLPQALVLTAIVIGFAMTALLLAIAIAAHHDSGTDHVDGEEDGPRPPGSLSPKAQDDSGATGRAS
jgi:multicomponent K+:H+ antiporter subunit C